MKVVIAKNILPPYRVEFLRELGKSVELTLALDAEREPGREWNVELDFAELEVVMLHSQSLHYHYKGAGGELHEKRARQISWRLWQVFESKRPDCIVSAEFGFRTILASIWCSLHKVPLVIWWEGTLHTEGSVSWLRRVLRKCLVARATRFWSNGLASRAYLENLGAAPESIDDGMTGVDTRFFLERAHALKNRKEELAQRYGIANQPVVLFSGALTRRKGVSELLDALEALETKGGASFTCLLAGDGELRDDIERRSRDWSTVRVVLLGFIQKEELCECYSLADVFVLPTLEDNWALATLEPLLYGVPSMISICNGAVEDLIIDDTAEFLSSFDPRNHEQFVRVLEARLDAYQTRIPDSEVERLAEFYRADSQAARALACIKKACFKKS